MLGGEGCVQRVILGCSGRLRQPRCCIVRAVETVRCNQGNQFFCHVFVYTVTRKFEQSQVELVWLPFVSFVKLEDELLRDG